ncbi:hypothetical protein HYDPIDRAFT_30000 [Hydnomerulius pinastri MD-312]|uniref:Indole-diterpene biosynthesis protein PaxU n=1 Tax=Hydnomerulius pinastri MD-312 TaxID=994086 RepID=A0A0C9W707_9AGAM|nr:hypothetical protein HYDPIDRAFT_30000 [Hydnomerulius pinastri MD-312]
MPRPKPPAGFVTIGEGIYISLAHASTCTEIATNGSAPQVILIFGWMGATTRHLQNYIRPYAELYPNATQILVKCGPSFIWTSERAKGKRLLPVAEALETLGCLPSSDPTTGTNNTRPRVLIHAFSNGGSGQLTALGRLLSSKYPTISPSEQLVSALILDSCPATGDVRSIKAAFTFAIRNPVARYIALSIIYFFHAIRLGFSMVFGKHWMVMEFLKLQLFKPRLLPGMSAQTPRLYIYSRKDELVPWQEVQQHAETAREKGLNVRCEVFEESAHVAHMRLDPKRYWASVQDVWEVACQGDQAKGAEIA